MSQPSNPVRQILAGTANRHLAETGSSRYNTGTAGTRYFIKYGTMAHFSACPSAAAWSAIPVRIFAHMGCLPAVGGLGSCSDGSESIGSNQEDREAASKEVRRLSRMRGMIDDHCSSPPLFATPA